MLKATAPEINHLDLSLVWCRQKNVLGLEIAVNHTVPLQQNQTTEELLGEAPDQSQREAPEIVALDELVKIHTKQFGRNTQMSSKVE